MLYREVPKRSSPVEILRRLYHRFSAVPRRQRRGAQDFRDLSPYLQRDIGLID